MEITKDIQYVGVNDHQVDLFEGQYVVENGMAYNSYMIMDEKIAVCDTVDAHFTEEWLGNINAVLDGKKPDYLIVHHMEPDHSASIEAFIKTFPETKIVSGAKAFAHDETILGSRLCGQSVGRQRRGYPCSWYTRTDFRDRTDGSLAGSYRFL